VFLAISVCVESWLVQGVTVLLCGWMWGVLSVWCVWFCRYQSLTLTHVPKYSSCIYEFRWPSFCVAALPRDWWRHPGAYVTCRVVLHLYHQLHAVAHKLLLLQLLCRRCRMFWYQFLAPGMQLATVETVAETGWGLCVVGLQLRGSWSVSGNCLLNPAYTIQLVVKRVVQPVWQPAVSCKKHPTRCQTGLTMGLTTGCIVYTNIYPVVKRVWQPVWQQVLSCKRGFTRLNEIHLVEGRHSSGLL